MANKKRKNLSLKVKYLIWVTIFITLAIFLFLSINEEGGPLGKYLIIGLRFVFGWSVWLIPFIFILFAYYLLKLKEEEKIKNNFFIGLLIFILVVTALNKLIIFNEEKSFKEVKEGYLGFLIVWLFNKIFGFLASLIILISLGFIGLILIFSNFLKEETEETEEIEKKSIWQKIKEKIKDKREKKISEKIVLKPEEIVLKKEKEIKPFKVHQLKTKIDLPIDLLDIDSTKPESGDIKTNKLIIQKTLESFGIKVEMGEVRVGPTVTQYTLKPAEGIKLSQIVSLQNDLALALAAHPIRIEAPIPGQSWVGIEVPNKKVAIVRLREILASEEFKKRKSNLTIALGKDVTGNIWLADLGKMPHLLVAGATGSGKTVMLNSIIITLVYQNSPDELKFILIDPKRVELTLYNDLPHLLTPVITEVEKTINALKWAIKEMEKRFDIMAENKKRDIESFNKEAKEKLPYIVIIIDELADLMVAAPHEIETCIIRLAQMARATGIHLILATQRPSVDIITGLIKANITSRIAFSVASMTDSRTILDFSGAEKLLGRGDMLFISPELSKPKRLQGAYVSDQEIKRVVEYLRNIKEPYYQMEILEKKYEIENFAELVDDELLPQAREIVIQSGKASATLLQRRLRIGYARAARLLDLLEKEGTIGPAEGAKPREVLKKKNEL
jgi:S-DNA-T family DNA segregation ATPase FtsK/SpoIIIE